MIDTSQLSLVGIAFLTFVPMFVCALLLRAKGIVGILAIGGIIAVGVIILPDLEGTRLFVGAACAAAALAIGGKISDARERNKMMQLKDLEKKKRDARLNNL